MSLLLVTSAVYAFSAPSWWASRNVIDEAAVTNDFSVAIQGQLKWIATNAYDELELHLPDGAKASLETTIFEFSSSNNLDVVNLGQLKNLATLFYDRLIQEGYTDDYPWTSATTDDVDFAAANIGQIKQVFNIDITADGDDDEMPDWWEEHYFGSTSASPTDDADNDGYLNVYEWTHKTNPTNDSTIPSSTYFVSLTGSHTSPYDSWAKAAKNIQTALDAATNDYAVIAVDNGTYTGVSNRNLRFPDNPVMLTATSLNYNCVINCETNARGVVFDNEENRETVIAQFVIKNGSASLGGGVYCTNASPTIIRCHIQDSTAQVHGGGMSCHDGANPRLIECLIANNTAGEDGGGIDCSSSSPLFERCAISNNTALTHGGGGISCWDASDPSISHTTVIENNAIYGGGLYAYGVVMIAPSTFTTAANPIIRNCLFTGNSASTNGGAILCTAGSHPIIESSTITDNSATHIGGGIYASGGSNYNSIVYFNSAASSTNIYDYGVGMSYLYCDTIPTNGLKGGLGNIDGDPLFVGAQDFNLTSNSPCINTGTNMAWMTGSTDLDDAIRIFNSTVDIGAHEYGN